MEDLNKHLEVVKKESHRKTVIDMTGDVILKLEFPENDSGRSRKIVTRSRARPTGKYPSWKMGRMMQWESHNELNAFRLIDANASITSFQEQPLTIYFRLNGETHRHHPDILVTTANGPELWEIKPASEARTVAQRTKFLTEHLPHLGFAYRVVLGEELAKQPRLRNIQEILKFGRADISSAERELVRQILERTNTISWNSAARGDLGVRGRHVLAHLFLKGELTCDVDEPIANAMFSIAQATI